MIAKTAILNSKKSASVIDRKLRKITPSELVIEVEKCNLCTTDYQQWQGLREHQGYPYAGGHENTGIIIDKGQDVLELNIGDRVAIAYDYCGQCNNCRLGETYECKNVSFSEKSEDGYYGYFGLANKQIVDAKVAIKISKDLPAEEACFLEPLGTVVHGIKKLMLNPNSTVAVIGAGPMGLLNAICARAYGANVIITEISKKKIDRARKIGFEVIDSSNYNPVAEVLRLTNGLGVDASIGAVGLEKAFSQALNMIKKQNGIFLVFAAGYPIPHLTLDLNKIHYDEVNIIGTMGGNIRDFVEASKLLNNGKVQVSGCLENVTIPLREIQKAYQTAAKKDQYRVTVNCQEI